MIRRQLQTARLRLRRVTDDDVQVIFELNPDPDVIRLLAIRAQAVPAAFGWDSLFRI